MHIQLMSPHAVLNTHETRNSSIDKENSEARRLWRAI